MSDMTKKFCWWFEADDRFHVCESEDEAHSEAADSIDSDSEPGEVWEYFVAQVAHPMDTHGMELIAKSIGDDIEENLCCWLDDNNGAEEPSIEMTKEDKETLGKMVASFVREKADVHWWTADKKTTVKHTYIAGSNDAEGGSA
jgi:hypothetical protein